MQAQNIVIDDGLKRFTFTNTNNEVFAEFFFNPSDTSIIERYETTVDAINQVELKGDSNEDIEEYLKTLSNTFKEQLDYLLNRDNSDSLFRVYSPITVFANGDLFGEVIVHQIRKLIEQNMDVRLNKKIKKIEKYTKKYHR